MYKTDIVILRSANNKKEPTKHGLLDKDEPRVYEIPNFQTANDIDAFIEGVIEQIPDAVLVDVDVKGSHHAVIKVLRQKLSDPSIPVLAVLDEELAESSEHLLTELPVDSFVLSKWSEDRVSAKVAQMSKLRQHSQKLKQELADSSLVAVTALKAAAETGLLMQLVEWLNTSISIPNAADCLFSLCGRLELTAYCMLQDEDGISFYPDGMVHETAEKILMQAQHSSIRILSKNRIMVFRCDHLVLLITNAPWEDEDRYGRLRDILMQATMLTEGRIKTLRVNNLIKSQHGQVETIMNLIKDASRDTQNYARAIMKNLSRELQEAAMTLDLTEVQEETLMKLSEGAQDSIEVLYEGSDALEKHFHFLIESITKVKDLSDVAAKPQNSPPTQESPGDEITLF